jgi:hypothetical protein
MVNTGGSNFLAVLQGRHCTHAEERVVFISDITKRKQAEDALKELEK